METSPYKLVDQYKRQLNYLRISVTDRCNLRCIYCMPIRDIQKLKHHDILSYEEILRLSKIASRLGITKIRLTGGDPLARKGLCEFIPKLTSIKGIAEVSLTTNGIYLEENLEIIKAGGIKRLNISLDTLQKDKYEKITGFDGLKKVKTSIMKAWKLGFEPIKINIVVIKGVNDDEILDLARLSIDYPFHVRFIEYMPIGSFEPGKEFCHIPSELIKERLGSLGEIVPVEKSGADGPSERFKIEGAPGEIGFISPLTHHFCEHCNRLRLTANGSLRPCLLYNREVDIKGPMRSGATDNELAAIFIKAALNKPHHHAMKEVSPDAVIAQMSSIGG
ncbi:GTP 3',8-cyclase MoaA [Thermodesulfobacteriota bacterium]